MHGLILLGLLGLPPLIGSVAVMRLEGPIGFCIALAASLVLMREAVLVCMILMRRWQLFGRDLFLVELDGHRRWVDAFELKAIRVPCKIRRREFRPYFLDRHRRDS
jgi:hypothetical protein